MGEFAASERTSASTSCTRWSVTTPGSRTPRSPRRESDACAWDHRTRRAFFAGLGVSIGRVTTDNHCSDCERDAVRLMAEYR